MNYFFARASLLACAAVFLIGCADSPKTSQAKTTALPAKKKEPEFPTGPVSGKTALFAMDKEARVWAKDRRLISLTSQEVPGIPSAAGKYAMWRATFVSELRGQAHNMVFSVVDQPPMINKGITVEGEASWGGERQDAMAFEISDVPVDTEAAYTTALQKAVGWVSNHPDKKATFKLGYSGSLPAPTWYVIWGQQGNGFAAFIDGKKGTLIER